MNRRGFLGSLVAVAAGAVAVVKAKPVVPARPKLVINELSDEWACWFQAVADASHRPNISIEGAQIGQTIRVRRPQRYATKG